MSGVWGCSSLRAQRYEVLLRHLQKQVPLCQQRPSEGAAAENIGALDRNHGILMSLLEKGVTSMNIPDLAQMGYRFDCVTSYHKVRNHNEYRCYDIKYYLSESRLFGLSKVETGPPVKKP